MFALRLRLSLEIERLFLIKGSSLEVADVSILKS